MLTSDSWSLAAFPLFLRDILHTLLNDLFIAPFTGCIELSALQLFGKAVHIDDGVGIIMSVFIVFAVAQVLHERSWGIADMQGHGQGAVLLDSLCGPEVGSIQGIALRSSGHIDGCLGKGKFALRKPYEMKSLFCLKGYLQGLGVGIADVFAGKAHKPPGAAPGESVVRSKQ